MTAGRSHGGPVALTAARHLRDFGFTGWHLIRSQDYDPASDTLADAEHQVERQVVEAVQFYMGGAPVPDDSAVFLMSGKPRPKAGDGLVALTRHWLIENVDVIGPDGSEDIYALLCV